MFKRKQPTAPVVEIGLTSSNTVGVANQERTLRDKATNVVWTIVGLAFVLMLGFGVMATNGSKTQPAVSLAAKTDDQAEKRSISHAETKTPETPVRNDPPQMTAELITITPRGFEPNEITRPAGRVLFAIVNKSEFPTMTLRFELANGIVIGQMQMPRNRRRWSIPLDLPAGRYRIVDATRRGMVCNINITQ